MFSPSPVFLAVVSVSVCLSLSVFHDWYNKGRGRCYNVCGMVHLKDPLLFGKNSPRREWTFIIYPTPYNRK